MHINTWDYLKNNYIYHSINNAIVGNTVGKINPYNATKYLNNPKYEASIVKRIVRFIKHFFKLVFSCQYKKSFNKAIDLINKKDLITPIPRDVRLKHIFPLLDIHSVLALGATNRDLANDAVREIKRRDPKLLQNTKANGLKGVLFAKQYKKSFDRSRLSILELIDTRSGDYNLAVFFRKGSNLEVVTPEMVYLRHNIQRLSLSKMGLKKIPEEIYSLNHLSYLSFCENNLTEVPESIGRLVNLRELSFTSNKIKTLPNSMGQLIQMRILHLSNNKIVEIPDSLGHLNNLTQLYCSDNQLVNLPESIGELKELKCLDLSNNKLIELPKSIAQLTNLDYLVLSNNRFNKFPESIETLVNLAYLKISGERLIEIPPQIQNLKNLKRLHLDNNQLSSPEIDQIQAWLPNTDVLGIR